MAAVAERITQPKKTASNVSSTRTRRAYKSRRSHPRAAKTAMGMIAGVFLFLVFAYGVFAAHSLVQGRRYSQLVIDQREEKIRTERLTVRLNALRSPDKVIAAAAKSGMVYAKEYDYIGRAGRVASSAQ